MSLLRKIQDAACDQNIGVTQLLLQAKLLASRLGHAPLKRWVNCEVNGYKDGDELPTYRKLKGLLAYGDFVGMSAVIKGAEIPGTLIPEDIREGFQSEDVRQSMASLLELLKGGPTDNPVIPLPLEIASLFSNVVFRGHNCLKAWRMIPRGLIAGIVDAVRGRVLDLALEIEKENPVAGDAETGSTLIPPEKLGAIVNVTIMGGNNNVATNSSGVTQNLTVQIEAGNFETLDKYLAENEVPRADIAALRKILAAESPPKDAKSFGKKLSGWLGGMVTKAAAGTWSVAAPVATSVLTKGLCKYFGLSSE